MRLYTHKKADMNKKTDGINRPFTLRLARFGHPFIEL